MKKAMDTKVDLSWFTEGLNVCDLDEVYRKSSVFGNSYLKITKEQHEMRKKGKVLYEVDEYGTFIVLEREEDEK